jgi:hypothetical protein
MSVAGTSIGASVAGLNQTERAATHDKAAKDAAKTKDRARAKDQVDLQLSETEIDDAVRSLKGNGDEETREDRQEHGGYGHPAYTRGAKPASGQEPPTVDVKA